MGDIETGLLERGTNTNLSRLCVERERLSKVSQRLAVVDDALAHEVEGQDAVIAVGLLLDGGEDGLLGDGGADADVVDSGADVHVVDVEGADLLLLKVVCEGGVADLEGEDGGVGDVGEAVEVVAVDGRDVDAGLGHFEALEAVDAGESDGLLEGDLGGLEALDAHVSLALDGDGQGRVPEVPRVEVDEGLLGGAADLLGDVDEGQAGLGLGHAEGHDGSVGELVLEVHDGVEALNDGGDGVGGGDGGVDGNLDGVRLGVGDGDAIDAQGGLVDLVLDNAGEPDEYAECCVRRCAVQKQSRQLINLQRKNNDERADGQHDQDRPPPLPDEGTKGTSLGLLDIAAVDVVLELGLASLALIKTHSCSFISENSET